jgi:ComF family protein
VNELELIRGAFCMRCGAPAAHDEETGSLGCIHCADLCFSFRRNESIGIFSGKLRELLHLFKFHKRKSLFTLFSRLAYKYKRAYVEAHHILVPVPLTRTRYSERGFNQSALIARALSRITNIEYPGEILKRVGNSLPQSTVHSREMRYNNMKDSFVLRKKFSELIRGKDILLVDDVLTTGATASACAKVLYDRGAGNVDLLTVGRTKVSGDALYIL